MVGFERKERDARDADADATNPHWEPRCFIRTGTPGYMAPEVVMIHKHSSYGKPADVWSLGLTLFEIVTGRADPFCDIKGMPKVARDIIVKDVPLDEVEDLQLADLLSKVPSSHSKDCLHAQF